MHANTLFNTRFRWNRLRLAVVAVILVLCGLIAAHFVERGIPSNINLPVQVGEQTKNRKLDDPCPQEEGKPIRCSAAALTQSLELAESHERRKRRVQLDDQGAGGISRTKAAAPTKLRQSPLDDIERTLTWGNVAFNTPGEMTYGDSKVIQLLLSKAAPVEQLRQAISEDGATAGSRIQTAKHMSARLIGDGFEIRALSPETQQIGRARTTEWKWTVRPTWFGSQPLYLTLDAIVATTPKDKVVSVRTFSRMIPVHVSSGSAAAAFARDHWAIVAGLGAALTAMVGEASICALRRSAGAKGLPPEPHHAVRPGARLQLLKWQQSRWGDGPRARLAAVCQRRTRIAQVWRLKIAHHDRLVTHL
jgi:hypothetical protein